MQKISMEAAVALLDVGDDVHALDHAQQAFGRWLQRGDGIAVYVNKDLSSSEVGRRKFVSYGGPDAQIPGDRPPEKFPVMSTTQWAYVLEAVVPRGG